MEWDILLAMAWEQNEPDMPDIEYPTVAAPC